MLPIAPSTYFRRKAAAARSDAAVGAGAARRRADARSFSASGTSTTRSTAPRKVWKQLGREGLRVARCRVRRLMREHGPARRRARAGVDDDDAARRRRPTGPRDLVDRHFTATRPNQLWVADFTYVATWRGFVYVAFVIDVFARRIVGWRVSASLRTDFVLDALEQAIYARCGDDVGDLVHHSDRGSAVSVDALHRAAGRRRHRAVGRQPRRFVRQRPRRIGHRPLQDGGDSTARTVAARSRPSNSRRSTWVDWFNHRRLLEPIGYVPPAEYEARYYEQAAVA